VLVSRFQDTAGTSGLDFLEKVDELLPACVHKQVNSKKILRLSYNLKYLKYIVQEYIPSGKPSTRSHSWFTWLQVACYTCISLKEHRLNKTYYPHTRARGSLHQNVLVLLGEA